MIPVKRAKKLYLNGLSLAAVASRFGISKTTLRDMFRREGIPLRKPRETRCFKAPTAELERLYFNEKLSPSMIAKRVGITKSAVLSRLIRAGHQLRPRGGVRGRFKVPEVKTENLVRALREGLNYSEIAKRFGISRPAVVYRLKVAGCELPEHKHKVELPEEEVIRLYIDEKLSLEAIAERFDVAQTTIHRILLKRGVKLRHRTAHMKSWHAERKQKLAKTEQLELRLKKAWRPDDWWTKEWKHPGLARTIGEELLSREGYMSNEELAARLDKANVPCPYCSEEDWACITRPGSGANFVSDVRKWVRRLGKRSWQD